MSFGVRERDGRWLLLVAFVLEIFAIWFVHWIHTRGYGDTEVYRLGARALLRGYPLYGDLTPEDPGESSLPFIYPPFAALAFVPLKWLSGMGAVVAMSICSHLAILVTGYSFARSSPHLAPRAGMLALGTAAILPVTTLLEPARETLNYGQVNLVLMGLVAADCLLPRTRWPRGLLVGLAAAIKLTPLGFLLLFALRRDLRAIAVTIVTFLVTVLIGVLAAPADSAKWWLDTMWSTGDSFGAIYAGNVNLRALLARQDLGDTTLNLCWLAGSALLVVLAVLGMRYAARFGNPGLELGLNATLVLLISPISWSHHWVWAGPVLVLLFVMAARRGWYGMLIAVLSCTAVFAAGPQWYLPYTENQELHWTFSQQVLGNAYTLTGIGLLFCAAVAWWRFRPRSPVPLEHEERTLATSPAG